MPTIGIDASRAVSNRRTGTENYSLHLIRALCDLDRDQVIRLYYRAGSDGSRLPPASPDVDHREVRGGRLWTHIHLARALRRSPVDLLFVPAHVIPIVHPPSVVTIHDLGYLDRADDHPARQRLMLDATTRWNLRAARRVIVPSAFTASDIAARFPRVESKIDVVPHGVSADFGPRSAESIGDTLNRLGVKAPYVLSVGTIQPRKDYPTLAEAVAIHNRYSADIPLHLVVVGRPGWLVERVLDHVEPFREAARLSILTTVEDADLPALYSGAFAYVQSSRFEGFGMPILEAMACGAPVICADSSSLPEVAGAAGMLFETGNAQDLADRLSLLRRRPDTRVTLARRGIDRAKRFNWSRAADATLDVLERAMNQP